LNIEFRYYERFWTVYFSVVKISLISFYMYFIFLAATAGQFVLALEDYYVVYKKQ